MRDAWSANSGSALRIMRIAYCVLGDEREAGFPIADFGNDKQRQGGEIPMGAANQKGLAACQVDYVVGEITRTLRDELARLGLDAEDFNLAGMLSWTEVRNGIIRGKFREQSTNGAAALTEDRGQQPPVVPLDRGTVSGGPGHGDAGGDGGGVVMEQYERIGVEFNLCPEVVRHIIARRR